MPNQINNAQVVHLGRSASGNVQTVYSNDATKFIRNGYLPDIALQVIEGNYPHQLITNDARRDVESAGGKAMIMLVFHYIVAGYIVKTGLIEVSQTQIAYKYGLSRVTVNRCVQVLKNVGLLVDKGAGKFGRRIYAIPLVENYVSALPTREAKRVNERVNEPVKKGVKQGVNHTEHLQDIDIDNSNYVKVQDNYKELYDVAMNQFVDELKPNYNKKVASEFIRVMQYAPEWQKEPELYGDALKNQLGARTLVGGVVEAMSELEYNYKPPSKPACTCHLNCNGNLHENELGNPERCSCTS